MSEDIKSLKNRIELLEREIELKDKDLDVYKKELIAANQQLEELIINIHSQLKKALELQRQLVPTEFPHIPGFDFSTKFAGSALSGGDYFDIFEHTDRMRFGLLLSSATGYGLSALFLSLFMKFTFEARQKEQDQSPETLLKALQKQMIGQIQGDDAFHFFYGIMERRHLKLDYLNLGGVIAMHYQSADKTLVRLQHGLAPIQEAATHVSVTPQTVHFEPCDKLILCSPGLLRIQSPEGEYFGEERFYSLVKKAADSDVHNLRNEIFFQAEQFSQKKEFPGDLTVITLEVKERVLKLASV